MKEQATLHLNGAQAVQARQTSAASAANQWLNSRNELLSYLMEERVNNRQLMHIVHCSAAILAAIGMADVNLFGCGICIGWFAIALYLAKEKGGLR